MKDLADYRKEIHEIDEELIAVFEKRMKTVCEIGRYKKENGLPVKNKGREDEVWVRWQETLKNKELLPFLKAFFDATIESSCDYQETILRTDESKIAAYMGVPGSNGETAAMLKFGQDKIFGEDTFEKVIKDVESGVVTYGVLPVENSTTGAITDVYDLLIKSSVYIVDEISIDICHALLGVKGASEADIADVYSHAQGFSQCKHYLESRPWTKVPYYNTAISAAFVAECGDKTKAAIATPRAAEIYGLDVLNPCINTGEKNRTRFLIIAKELPENHAANKISIALTLPHVSGSLFRALETFKNNGLNMLKIESRPIVDRMGEYMFFIDFEGNSNQENTKKAFRELEEQAIFLKFLGNYPKAE